MNILFVYSHSIKPTKGGTERVIYEVSKYLDNNGHQCYFMSLYESVEGQNPAQHIEAPDKSDAQIAIFMLKVCIMWRIDVIINEIGEFCNYEIYSKVRTLPNIRLISCIHFDVIGPEKYYHTDEYASYPIKRLIDCFKWIKFRYFAWKRRRQFIIQRRDRFYDMLTFSDCVIVPSNALIEQLKRYHKSPCCIKCIPNPNAWDINVKESNEIKTNIAIYVGRLSRQKHVERIIKAWHLLGKDVNGWKLLIVGTGAMEKELRKLVRNYGCNNIEMLGNVENVHAYYEQASLALLTSDHESFSMFLMEALSHACFPIIYDFPASKTLLSSPEWGIRIKDHNIRSFVKALRYAVTRKMTNEHNFNDIVNHLKKFHIEEIGKIWNNTIFSLKEKKHC